MISAILKAILGKPPEVLAEGVAPPQPPLPRTISEEARKLLEPMLTAPQPPELPPALSRPILENLQKKFAAAQMKRWPVKAEETAMAGVKVRVFTPPERKGPADAILLNLHGGGFVLDSGSWSENVPIASMTGVPVVAVLYRLAPEHPYPAAVDDAEAVYRELLKSHPADRIVVYGTSAGCLLTAQLIHRLKATGQPLPAAIGVFAGGADFSVAGDSEQYLPRIGNKSTADLLKPYVGAADAADPALSPVHGDLAGWPATLVMSSTRDQFCSQSALLHRALLRAGVRAELVIFDALPHAFWAYLEMPETDEAFEIQARFFSKALQA